MDLSTITVDDFKTRFYRDFQYAEVPTGAVGAIPDPDFVQDRDITNAYGDAEAALNQALFGSDATIKTAYLLLAAHFVCVAIAASNGGINSPGNFPVSARTVGSVSESYGIPEDYLKSPILAGYAQTAYGLRYLAMALPGMTGNVAGVYGGTQP